MSEGVAGGRFGASPEIVGSELLPFEPAPRRRRAARVYAIGLLVLACGTTVAALGAGAALPSLGVCFALAVPLALCMNRFVFFPNEVGVTAEAAVLFAAIVAFRAESPFLGPLVLAFLVGVLDARHWERRAFVRMAYNSGSQALTVLVAVVAFGPMERWCGSSGIALVLAAGMAAVPYVVVETVFGVTLMVLLGEPARVAVRQQVPANMLALPLAAFGAVAGLLVTGIGPWLGALLLVPTPLVPEVVLVGVRRKRWNGARAGWAALVVAIGAGGVALASSVPTVAPATLAALGALSLLLGADARVGRDHPVPRSAVPAIVAVSVLVPGGWMVAVCAAAAVLATGSAWWVSRRGPGGAPAVALAAGGAAFAAGVGLAPTARSAMATLLAASVVGIVFLLVTTRKPVSVLWSVPLVAASAGVMVLARSSSDADGPVVLLLVVVVAGSASTWGALPWSSRYLGPWGGRRTRAFAVGVLAGASLCTASACAWWAITGATGAAEAVTASALVVILLATTAVRQWRFAPFRRRRDIAVLAGAGACLLGAGPFGARTAGWSVVASLAAVAAAGAVALGCMRRAGRRDGPRHRVGLRRYRRLPRTLR
jgi:hypothetical protein